MAEHRQPIGAYEMWDMSRNDARIITNEEQYQAWLIERGMVQDDDLFDALARAMAYNDGQTRERRITDDGGNTYGNRRK